MRTVSVAATQMACDWNVEANLSRAEHMVCDAAARGAQIVLLQELFETPYFCIDQNPAHFALAKPYDGHPWFSRFAALARRDLLGPMVSGMRSCDGAGGSGDAVLSDGDRQRAARFVDRFARIGRTRSADTRLRT